MIPFRAIACVACLALACVQPALAQDAASDPQRIGAAKELIEVTGAKKQIDLMLDIMKQGLGAGARQAGAGQAAEKLEGDFAAFSERFAGYRDQMVEEFAGLYASRFTTQELQEITTFYRSGTGAKFIVAMPELMQKGGEIGQKYGLMAARELDKMKNKKP